MEVGAEMKHSSSDGRREEQVRELEELVERARVYASRLGEIDEQVSLRRQLESGRWPEPGSEQFTAWEAVRETVERFYAEFGELVERARIVLDGFRGWIGSVEVESLQGKLHKSAVRSTCEALEWALERAREFRDAEMGARRRRQGRSKGVSESLAQAQRDGGPIEGSQTVLKSERVGKVASEPPSWVPSNWFQDEQGASGRWVTAAVYARVAGISAQTLAN